MDTTFNFIMSIGFIARAHSLSSIGKFSWNWRLAYDNVIFAPGKTLFTVDLKLLNLQARYWSWERSEPW
jgi:hypothetical protein